MDNQPEQTYEQLPRQEALIRLYELRDSIDRLLQRRGVLNPHSEAERHLVTHGHRLAFGCCREVIEEVPADTRPARAPRR